METGTKELRVSELQTEEPLYWLTVQKAETQRNEVTCSRSGKVISRQSWDQNTRPLAVSLVLFPVSLRATMPQRAVKEHTL